MTKLHVDVVQLSLIFIFGKQHYLSNENCKHYFTTPKIQKYIFLNATEQEFKHTPKEGYCPLLFL